MASKRPHKIAALDQKAECIELSNISSLTVEEKGIAATFKNYRRKEIRKIRYDGCYQFVAAQGHADYIIGFDGKIDVVLELKGSELKRAVIQVGDTLDRWKKDPIHYSQIVCLIVFGHTFPRMRSNLGVLEREFLAEKCTFLRIRQSGEDKFSFNKLAGKY
ncbi:hypothetical protein [Terracidiphilus sp.]|uniref:hypothetical protein n=1 Tax=Terracidiphilus sp. TaxID=1964191 RepID=UPI003C140256